MLSYPASRISLSLARTRTINLVELAGPSAASDVICSTCTSPRIPTSLRLSEPLLPYKQLSDRSQLLRLLRDSTPHWKHTLGKMADEHPLVFRWGIISTGFIAAAFVKVSPETENNDIVETQRNLFILLKPFRTYWSIPRC